jgi:hypothetical protein
MAYEYRYASVANRAAGLTEIWTALNNMGWTLHDNRDGSSYRVYSSNGEQADRITEYILIYFGTANTIDFDAYYKWVAGVSSFGGANLGRAYYSVSSTNWTVVTTSETGFNIWIHGNKDLVIIHTKVSTAYYPCMFGHIPKRFDETVGTLTEAATSGSNVDLVVDDITGFVVSGQYQIVGASHEGREVAIVTDIIPDPYGGGILTIDALDANMSVGSKIGHSPSTFGKLHMRSTVDLDISSHYWYYTCGYYSTMLSLTNMNDLDYCAYRHHIALNTTDFTLVDPDYRTGKYVALPLSFYVNDYSAAGEAYRSWYAYDDTFILNSDDLTSDDIVAVTVRVRSTATGAGGGSNTLADTGQSWSTNEHAGRAVLISSGTGSGQIRKIVSNTATELTLDKNWYVAINATSVYRIADEGYRYIRSATLVREGY